MISKDSLDSSQIDILRNLFLSLPGASASLVQARLRDGYCLALSLKDIRYYIDQFRLESISSSSGTLLHARTLGMMMRSMEGPEGRGWAPRARAIRVIPGL